MQGIKVFEGTVNTATVYSDSKFNEYLGAFKFYSFFMVVGPNSAAAGTCGMRFEASPDGAHWINKNSADEVTSPTMSTSTEVQAQGQDLSATCLPHGYGRVGVKLSAGAAGAPRVQIWALGRNQ